MPDQVRHDASAISEEASCFWAASYVQRFRREGG